MLGVFHYWRWAWKGKAFQKWKEDISETRNAAAFERQKEEAIKNAGLNFSRLEDEHKATVQREKDEVRAAVAAETEE